LLSADLREELATIAPRRRCCRLAEVSALLHTSGSWHLQAGQIGVHLDLGSGAAARRAFALLRDLGVRSEIRTYHRHAFDRSTRYQLHVTVDPGALAVLEDAGVLSAQGAPLELPPKRVVGRSCCRAAYLRGALLAVGSLSGPRGPHLELRVATPEAAALLARIAAREDVPLRVALRRGTALAYAKGREAIESLLAVAGAGEMALRLEEDAVIAASRAEANRLANADAANLFRTAHSAQRQLEAIRELGLDGLPAPLALVAELRLRHPSASLRELAAKARPPLTKATVQRRLDAIVRQDEARHPRALR
jgi:cell division protein WhiA